MASLQIGRGELSGIPEYTAHCIMMTHGSRLLLAAQRGEPEEIPLPPANVPVIRRLRPYRAPVKVHQAHRVPTYARRLLKLVAEDMGLSADEVIGRLRFGELVAARAVIARILRERGWSYPRIGAALGGRDHSTVINLCAKWDIYAERDPLAAKAYETHKARAA